MTAKTAPKDDKEKITCCRCGAKVHSIKIHIERDHAAEGYRLEDYQREYPDAPLLSEIARIELAKRARASAATAEGSGPVSIAEKKFFHETFGYTASMAGVMSSKGKPIPVGVLPKQPEFADMVPALDPNYVFNLDTLKSLMLAIEMNIPAFLWGHSGTGKTTIFEQIAARTNRPMVRVQHTANMEEEHIVGGWRLRDGKTFFEFGPLPMAMKHGWIYMADEYDFGRPEVLSVYQAVLEGKALFIKEADTSSRVVKPHPDFRFVATGNTNGQGDESGLYQGTNLQNAANFERFGCVEQMHYMDKKLEAKLVSQQADISLDDAAKLVDFATRIRAEFDSSKISNPISPRALINAAKIGIARDNYKAGLEKAFINRLSAVDREAATQVAQRVFS
jgi:cobaltochelatase CobS